MDVGCRRATPRVEEHVSRPLCPNTSTASKAALARKRVELTPDSQGRKCPLASVRRAHPCNYRPAHTAGRVIVENDNFLRAQRRAVN